MDPNPIPPAGRYATHSLWNPGTATWDNHRLRGHNWIRHWVFLPRIAVHKESNVGQEEALQCIYLLFFILLVSVCWMDAVLLWNRYGCLCSVLPAGAERSE
jgi:hypothetical protein